MNGFDGADLVRLHQRFQSPLWAYNANLIRNQISRLKCFDTVRFAQKACSNVHILRLMLENDIKVDSVSLGEIERALVAGYRPGLNTGDIVFTADVIDAPTLERVKQLGIPVNAGSIDMLEQLGSVSPGHHVWLRINPGFGHGHSLKANTGGESSKHGIWHESISDALVMIDRYQLHLVGIHIHIGSGTDYEHLAKVCGAMRRIVIGMKRDITAISAGGGLPVPYQENEEEIDIARYYGIWNQTRLEIEQQLGHPVSLELEPGRYITAQSGILVTEVRSVKDQGGRHFVLVDVGFNDLMRPVLYGSYHRISALDTHGNMIRSDELVETVVGGPLCESGDVFTQKLGGEVESRMLPPVKPGDFLVIHDTGAYGASESSNYNSRPLLPEIMYDNGTEIVIRRKQSIQDLIALEIS